MKIHQWHDIRRERVSDKRAKDICANVEHEVEQLNLREVRRLAGKTQTDVARASAVAQGELSRIERRQDHRVSTLRKYVEALGGELQIVAQFGNRSVRLKGV
jgi:predicted transcriptional regulator